MSQAGRIKELEDRILKLETDNRHLSNELQLTRQEYETSTRDYFDIYSNLDRLVRKRTEELEKTNRHLLEEIAERNRAESQALASEKRYRTIFDSNHDAIMIMKDGVFLDCNTRALSMLGLPRESIIGKTPLDFSPEYQPDGRSSKESVAILKDESDGGDTRKLVWQFLRKDGAAFDAEVTINRVRLDGEVVLQGMVRDITEKQRALTALKESERKYKLLAENTTDVIWIIGLDGAFLYVSPSVERLRGTDQESVLKLQFLDMVHPEYRSWVMQRLERRLKLKTHDDGIDSSFNQFELPLIREDGTQVWTETSVGAVRNEKGELIAFSGVTRDISERKRAEDELRRYRMRLEELVRERTADLEKVNLSLKAEMEERLQTESALRESERRYRAVVEDQTELVCRLTPDFGISFVNLAYCRHYGVSREVLKGRLFTPLEHASERAAIESRLHSLGPDSPVTTVTLRDLRWDSKRRWMQWTLRAFFGPNGAVLAYQAVGRDVTEAKDAEEKLQQAKDIAEEANRLKSRFVFNVSHEIRTPLNGIIGFAEIIRESHSLDMIHQQADTILQESDALLMLVNDLLDHAKIEAGKMELDRRPMNLFRLLENIMANAQLQARSKGLEFHVSVEPDTPKAIKADFLRLRQILLNLVTNAIKFTETGSVVVSVSTLSKTKETASLRFAVKDTGIGIEKEKQAAIFQSFTQADVSTTRKYGGTGLGTTIARQLVELMGGSIELESTPGKGSTFFFTIPAEIHEGVVYDLDDDIDIPDLTPEGISRVSTCSGRILLAEDYITNQQVARVHIEKAGYFLMIVENGKMAVEACKERAFDLILMDLQMPVMDGHEATRLIREGGTKNTETPIVAMTASAEASTHEACLNAGMNDVITKPIRQATFLRTLKEWIPSSAACSDEDDGSSLDVAEQSAGAHLRPFDMQTALEEFGNDRDLLDTVISQFLNAAEGQMEHIRMSARDGDFAALAADAHKLKGGAGNLTAMPLFEAARELEMAAKSEKTEIIEEKISAVVAAYRELRAEFAPPSNGALSFEAMLDTMKDTPRVSEPSDQPPLEYDEMLDQFDGDRRMLNTLLEQFLTSATAQMQALVAAIQNGDTESIAALGHKLKGGAANMMAEPLRGHAAQLERLGKAGELEDARAVLPELERELMRLGDFIGKQPKNEQLGSF